MFSREQNGPFIPLNFQPGKVQHRVQYERRACPNYQLIEICGQFVGIDPKTLATTNRFCGQVVEHEDTLEILSGHRGENYYPEMFCTKIRDRLIEMLYQAQKDVSLPGEDLMETLKRSDPVQQEVLLKKALGQTAEYNRKQQVLKTWRSAVYEISNIPPESGEEIDPHFRRRTIEELTDVEIIETVEKFLHSLETGVTGKGGDPHKGTIFLNMNATHCPQSPDFEQTGEIS